MLFAPSEPFFRILYKGIDISSEVEPHLISCTYTDKVHGEADEIEVTVQDKDGLWRGPWCPEHGDKVRLWIGYKGGVIVPCGEFEIDEPAPRLSRSGDTFSFRGVSAPVSKALRTQKTKRFENKSLRQIAGEIAGGHGLTVMGTPPDVTFKDQPQRRERDLEFLSRLADEYGAYFSVRGSMLIFTKREELHDREPVFTLRAESDDYISCDLKRASHKTYSKAKLSYFEGNEKKKIEVEVEDGKVKNGDTLKLDDRVENEGQARLRAKAQLEKENLKRLTGNALLVGNPLLLAGQIMALDAGFGKWATNFVIKQSRHHLTRAGYTTNIEFHVAGSANDGKPASGAPRPPAGSNGRKGFVTPGQRA